MTGTGWWVEDAIRAHGYVFAASWAIWVIGSIVLHELAHGWAALWQGDRTPVWSGHMTWNPVVHMGVPSLIFLAIIGYAWGQMPVDPTRFRSRWGEVYVSAAGPAMNALLFVLCAVGCAGWLAWSPQVAPNVLENVTDFLWAGCMINIVLALFNLIPVPPLDGSRILGELVPSYRRWLRDVMSSDRGLFIAFVGVAFVFMFFGSAVAGGAYEAAGSVIAWLVRLFGGVTP